MAEIQRLVTARDEQERRDAATVISAFARLPPHRLPAELRAVRSLVLRELRRVVDPDEPIWPGGYAMLSRVQAVAVWDAIHTLPNIARRNQVHRAFDLICVFVERETCEVLLTRAELAERLGTAPFNVTRIMATLKELGVISRTERRRIPGVKGPGEVVYFINPHVAWNGNLEVRKREAQKIAPPLLKVMRGGAGEP